MYLTILLDAEDIVDPRSDDISLEIARMFAEEGAPATFGVTGEKTRLWEKRGRTDIIEAVSALDVNYHSNFSSVHPTVAEYLEAHPKIEQVDYLGLPSNPRHEIAKKYMMLVDSEREPGGPFPRYGHLMSFRVAGGGEAARRVFDAFRMIYRATDLGRIKSVATIPAISTHQQQGEEARQMADVPPNLIRFNVGGEHPDDIIADLEQSLRKA